MSAGRCGYVSPMRIMRTLAKAGIAKKVYDEARKPHNQAKIRDAVDKLRNRGQKRPGTGA